MKFSMLLSLLVVMFTAISANAKQAVNFTPRQIRAIQSITHDYIVSHPTVLVEAAKNLQQQQMSKVQKKAVTLIGHHVQAIFHNRDDMVVGDPKGRVTLVEFYDYQCEHCKDVAAVISSLMAKNRHLRVVFKQLPIFGKYSTQAAQAAMVAYGINQARFLAFHSELMQQSIPFNGNTVKAVADRTGYHYAKLSKKMTSDKYKRIIKANFNLATTLLKPTIGVVATPVIIVGATNNTTAFPIGFMPGEADQKTLQAMIDKVTSRSY